jgi:hypothetical protein
MIEIHNFSKKKVLKEQKQEFGVLVLVVVKVRGDRSVLGKRNPKAMNNIPIAS